jgi:hypothetical protein
MLSGKWGSGKTYFWKNKIQTVLNDKEIKIPNHYISLYGKISIQEIKNEIFLKVFESVDSFKSEEKTKKIVKGSIDLVSSLTKSISVFGMSLDLSKITDTSFKKIDDLLNDEKLKRTENYLNSGAIICFDDFERKSKDIDLNDLFGFITQLTLNFNCKVVIILNDDVFEGEEKKIFSNVKEKSVSKFLKYEPSIRDLFNLIFYGRREDNKKKFKYLELRKLRKIILKTIEETKELNARIYIQVLDKLVEWLANKQEIDNDILRCLILVNINFVLYHKVFELKSIEIDDENNNSFEPKIINVIKCFVKTENSEDSILNILVNNIIEKNIDIGLIKSFKNFNREIPQYVETLIKDKNLISSMIFNKLDISRNIDEETFQKINNFIETGILINE